ncbi:LacI family DNA-binding transcriptional regulator [Rhizosphaericola mali]|uniref:LacI family transcriptional regulator n=1 Tax=Rhizosphaericola mali TaxID=2545455 RepID=A0A5P2G5N7_9BACT|nr:LacI family DNA-binding transcriptional regulator [Rhizosphaericola mali]QES89479.1 LacI family transcriptional regulator [Rhizosphaericola mali]
MKKVSIKDVAQKAGVSTALVSYVINGRLQERINEQTAQKIKDAIKELNYRPNRIAQSLKLQKTFTIGLIVPDIANPFSSAVARLIEDEATKQEYSLLIASSDENIDKLKSITELFINRQVDGLIIGAVENSKAYIQELTDRNIPLVLIDRYFSDVDVCSVSIDNFAISGKAAQNLLDQGRKNVAVFSYKTTLEHLNARVEGFEQTIAQNKEARSQAFYIDEKLLPMQMSEAFDHLFENNSHIDGLYFTTNKLAVEGIKQLIQRKIQVPEKVNIVAFDETDAFDLYTSPLYYIQQPLQLLAETSVDLLTQQIDNNPIAEKKVQFESTLILKKSIH